MPRFARTTTGKKSGGSKDAREAAERDAEAHVLGETPAPNVSTNQSEEERRRDQRIRDALVRDRVTCPHPRDRVTLYGEAGTLTGEVLYALAFKPSADAWVAEVQYQGAGRSRAAVIKRMREGWVEVGEHG